MNPIKNKNRRRHTGMTLVELMIAMVLFSLVLTMLYSGMHSSAKSWRLGEAKIEDNENKRMELAFVKKYLSQTVPLVLLDGEENPLLFKGEGNAVHFTANLPGHRGGGGLHLLSLNTSGRDGGKELTLSYHPVTPDTDLDNPEDSQQRKSFVLLDNIENIEFAYFGSDDDEIEPRWHDEWLVRRNLPEVVHIHIEPVQEDEDIPDIIVKLYGQATRGQPQLTLYNDKINQFLNSGPDSLEDNLENIQRWQPDVLEGQDDPIRTRPTRDFDR